MRNKAIYALLAVASLVSAVSCSKMDDTYKEFVVPGGITYLGRADSLSAFPGKGRIQLNWWRGTDPKPTKAVVYWNNNSDSMVVPLPKVGPRDTVKAVVNGLPEGTYTFRIVAKDDQNNASIPAEVQGTSYGDIYESTLMPRLLQPVIRNGNTMTLNWSNGDETNFATEVIYTAADGAQQKVYLSPEENSLELEVELGAAITYRGLYKPVATSLDTFFTETQTLFIGENLALGKTITASSNAGANPPSNLNDEKLSTLWQPLSADRNDNKMVWVTADLGTPTAFNQVKQVWTTGSNLLTGYRIFGSDDDSSWELIYEKIGRPMVNEEVSFPAATYRYVRIETTIGGSDGNLQVAELEIYNKP